MEKSRGREWLEEKSDVHKAIVSIFKEKKFKSGCKYLMGTIHINNIILKYLLKQKHSEYDHMVMGAYLAALDNNLNSERGQHKKFGKNIGKYKYKIAWKKVAHMHVARRLYQKKQYGNIKIMVKSVREYIKKHNKKSK